MIRLSLFLPITPIIVWVWSLWIFPGPPQRNNFLYNMITSTVLFFTIEDLKAIDRSKAYDERRNLENLIWEQAEKIQDYLITKIVELDHVGIYCQLITD